MYPSGQTFLKRDIHIIKYIITIMNVIIPQLRQGIPSHKNFKMYMPLMTELKGNIDISPILLENCNSYLQTDVKLHMKH